MPVPAALAVDDDVAAGQGLHLAVQARPARPAVVAGQLRLGLGDAPAQRGVLAEVPQVAVHALLQLGQAPPLGAGPGGELDDAPVGLELGEGGLQDLPGARARGAPQEVDRHVVGGAEGGHQRVGAARGQGGDEVRLQVVGGQDDGVALDVDAAPPGPARQLRVLPGGEGDVGRAVPLAHRLQHHRPGGHIDAQRQGLGGVDDLDQAGAEELLDGLLEDGQQSGVVRGDPALQGVGPGVEAQDAQVGPGDVGGAAFDDLADAQRLVLGGQVHSPGHRLGHRLLAPGAGEDEDDGGQEAGPLQGLDDRQPRGRAQPGRARAALAAARGARRPGGAAPPRLGRPAPTRRRPVRLAGPGLPRGGAPGRADRLEQVGVERRLGREPGLVVGVLDGHRHGVQIQQAPADHHVLGQGHRPVLGDDDGGAPAHLPQPVAELLRVGHGRGQGDHPHLGGEVDDDLLPHGPAEAVGEVVDLVHDHVAEPVQVARAGVEHIAQDLGGHDHDVGARIDGGVAGEQPHRLGAVTRDQVQVLLIAQRLDGGGVEGLEPAGQPQVDGELAHDGLAGAGGRRHEDALAVLQGPAGAHLEVVEGEVVAGREARQLAAGFGLAASGLGVALCR